MKQLRSENGPGQRLIRGGLMMVVFLSGWITAGETDDILPPVQPELDSALHPPRNVTAVDVPNDEGGSVRVRWEQPEGGNRPNAYVLEFTGPDGLWQRAVRTVLMEYIVTDLENFTPYRFRVAAIYGDRRILSESTEGVEPRDHWLMLGKIPVLAAILIFVVLLLVFIEAARRGIPLFIRRITGLNAVEDAIGRATEMGQPVLYVPGTSTIEDVATLASLNILGEIARRTVHYDVKIICPNIDPIVFTIAREIVRETYSSEGRPDAFDPDSVFFLVPEQFAYAAGVDGIMVRQKPATIFLLGMFWAESLIMAETGASTGAVQIAGTDEVSQLPFFVTACDFTLIGEELYAASAYLAREPMLLGTLKAQDYGKLIFMICMVTLTVIALVTGWDTGELVRVR
ncbi:fibronectin type III domain-containing protein [bacterium]|nr:fibronectin type III domain-containing protein [candidate division CSSED10-310 bacterium]